MPPVSPLLAAANRFGNPVVAAIVRSPLERFVRPRTVLVTYTGRRTGRSYTIPVWAKVKGDTLRIGVGFPSKKRWWLNLRGEGARVKVLLDRQERTGHAVATGDAEQGVRVTVEMDPR
jgi:hypothetical protein